MNEYQLERKKELEELLNIISQISNHLKDWNLTKPNPESERFAELEINSNHKYLKGATIIIERIWNKKERLEIRGRYPRYKSDSYHPYNNEVHNITVSINKEPSKIASDIIKRFIPNYIGFYSNSMKKIIEYEKQDKIKHSNLLRLKENLSGIGEIRDEAIYISFNGYYGHIKTDYQGDCKFDIDNIPLGKAIKICKILSE